MSKNVFVSYVRENDEQVKLLAEDLRDLGHEVWFDRAIPAGARWWNVILERIRSTDVVAAVLSPTSIESFAFEQETKYACLVNRLILPVMVEPVRDAFVPKHLSAINRLDYTSRTPATALALGRAFSDMPPTPQLPQPLPADPSAPEIFMPEVQRALESRLAMSRAKQLAILQQLRTSVGNPADYTLAMEMLRKFRERTDTTDECKHDLDELLSRWGGRPPTGPVPRVVADPATSDPPVDPKPPTTRVEQGPQERSRVKIGKSAPAQATTTTGTTSTAPSPSASTTGSTRAEPTASGPTTASSSTSRVSAPADTAPTSTPVPAAPPPSWGTAMFTLLIIGAVVIPIVGLIAGVVGLATRGKRSQGLALIVAAIVGLLMWGLIAQSSSGTA